MSEVKCQLESAPKRIATMLQSFSFLKFQEVCWIFQSTYDSQHFITIKSVSKKLIYKKKLHLQSHQNQQYCQISANRNFKLIEIIGQMANTHRHEHR
jgi:aspartokinase